MPFSCKTESMERCPRVGGLGDMGLSSTSVWPTVEFGTSSVSPTLTVYWPRLSFHCECQKFTPNLSRGGAWTSFIASGVPSTHNGPRNPQ